MLVMEFSRNELILNCPFLVQTLCPGSVVGVLKLNNKVGLALNVFTGADPK